MYSISQWRISSKNRQVAKPYVVSHHAQWLGCCSTIQLSCIAVRDLESTLRFLVGKLMFNIEVITFSTKGITHFFVPTQKRWGAFLQNPNSLKRKIICFLGDGKKCASISGGNIFSSSLCTKNHQRELSSWSFASARPQKTIQNAKSATCENVVIFPNHATPNQLQPFIHHVMPMLWSYAKH